MYQVLSTTLNFIGTIGVDHSTGASYEVQPIIGELISEDKCSP